MKHVHVPFGITTLSIGGVFLHTAKIRVTQENALSIDNLVLDASAFMERHLRRRQTQSGKILFELVTADMAVIKEFTTILKKAKIKRLERQISDIQESVDVSYYGY